MTDENLLKLALCQLYEVKFSLECGGTVRPIEIQRVADLLDDLIEGNPGGDLEKRLRADKPL